MFLHNGPILGPTVEGFKRGPQATQELLAAFCFPHLSSTWTYKLGEHTSVWGALVHCNHLPFKSKEILYHYAVVKVKPANVQPSCGTLSVQEFST